MKGSGTSRSSKPALKSGKGHRGAKKSQIQQRHAKRMTIAEIKAGEEKAVANGLIRRPEVNRLSHDPLHDLSLSFPGGMLSGLDSTSYIGRGNLTNMTGLGHTNELMPVENSWDVNLQLNSMGRDINWEPNMAPPYFGSSGALAYFVASGNDIGMPSQLPLVTLQNSQAMDVMSYADSYSNNSFPYNGHGHYETPESVTTSAASHVYEHPAVGYANSTTDSLPQPLEIPALNGQHYQIPDGHVYTLDAVPEGQEYIQATEPSYLQHQDDLLLNHQPRPSRDPLAFYEDNIDG